MTEIDLAFVFMPLEEAQLYFNQDGLATGVEIYVMDPDRHRCLMKPGSRCHQSVRFVLTDWRARNASFFTALQVERNVMFMILTLIVLVAALNIISGMIMLVKDKGRDIAVSAHHGGVTRRDHAGVPHDRRVDRHAVGTLVGLILGVIVCLNMLNPSANSFLDERYGACSRRKSTISPELPADMATGRRHGRRHDGAGAVVPGDGLSGMAGGQARSGRSAPV
jgi:hypothetical protein